MVEEKSLFASVTSTLGTRITSLVFDRHSFFYAPRTIPRGISPIVSAAGSKALDCSSFKSLNAFLLVVGLYCGFGRDRDRAEVLVLTRLSLV